MKANAGNMKHFWAYKKKRLDACVSANSHNGWMNNKDKDASYIEQQCNSAGAHRIWFTSEPLEVLCNKKSTMRCSLMHRLYKVSSFAAGRLTSLKPTMWLFKTLIAWYDDSEGQNTTFQMMKRRDDDNWKNAERFFVFILISFDVLCSCEDELISLRLLRSHVLNGSFSSANSV